MLSESGGAESSAPPTPMWRSPDTARLDLYTVEADFVEILDVSLLAGAVDGMVDHDFAKLDRTTLVLTGLLHGPGKPGLDNAAAAPDEGKQAGQN